MSAATVTRAEGHLLTLARVAVGVVPPADALRLLVSPVMPPGQLGPTARALLSETLARGTALSLARGGGWLPRLAERPALHFSANTVRLLCWVLAVPLGEAQVAPLRLSEPPTPAEDFLVAHLMSALRGTGCDGALARQPALQAWPLTALSHAALLGRATRFVATPRFDLAALRPWVSNLRGFLTGAWLWAERLKHETSAVDELARMGQAQGVVLDAFLDAVGEGARPLASFLVDVAVRSFEAPPTTSALAPSGPLRERQEARRHAGAPWRALARLHAWDAQHRLVRFIDDGYDEAQALVADWARLGEPGFARAAALVASLDALA